MSRLPFLAALFACLVVAHAGEPHPSLPPPVIPDCLGVDIHFTDPKPGELEMIAAAGFKWVRMDFGWGGIERVKGEYDFSAFDRLAASLDKFHMRAVFILDYGNPLYANPGEPTPFTARANTPEFRTAFTKWAVAAVQHFKGRGYLWEMWNEPNGGFWKSADKTGDYIALAKATGEALRQAGLLGPKGEAFIGPATSTIDLPYLEACFKAGLLDYWDAVSVHPYRQNAPETVEDEYRSLRLLIRKYAPKDKAVPIISGEWGYSSAWTSLGKDEAARAELQGKYLPREFLTNIANDVALSIWYDWHDDGTDPKEGEHRFGIVGNEYHPGRDPVYDPKPAYTAMKTLTEQLGGYQFNKTFRYFPPKQESWLNTDAELVFTRPREPDFPCPEMQLWASDRSVALVSWTGKRDPMDGAFPARYFAKSATDYLGHGLPIPRQMVRDWRFEVGDKVEYRTFGETEMIPWLLAGWKRLPLDTVVKAPANVDVEVSMNNPLDHRIILPGWRKAQDLFAAPEFWNPGLFEKVLAESTEFLEGHQTTTRRHQLFVGRIPERFVEQVPLELMYGRGRQVFSQSLHALPENPLSVTFVGATGEKPIELIAPLPAPGSSSPSVPVMSAPRITMLHFEIADETGGDLPTKIGLNDWSMDVGGGWGEWPVEFEKGQRKALISVGVGEGEMAGSVNSISLGKLGDMLFEMEGVQPLALEASQMSVATEGDQKVRADVSVQNGSPADLSCPLKTPWVKLNYRMEAGWKYVRVTPKERSIEANGGIMPRAFGLWVQGDGKGCQARIRFVDSTGQTFQTDGAKIDWVGWKYVSFPMRESGVRPLTHWGGADDGEIHYPIKWDSIFLLDNASREPVEGEIHLSAPTLVY